MGPDWTRIVRWLGVALALIIAAAMGFRAAQLAREPYLGMSERGAEIALVIPQGPADRAGLRSGDLLRSIDGVPLARISNPPAALRAKGWSKGVFVTAARDGRLIHTEILPEPLPAAEVAWRLAHAAIALGTLLVGALVFLRKAGRQTAVFFGICLALSTQLFHPYILPTPWGYRLDSLTGELLSALLPGLLLHFFLLFPYERHALKRYPWLHFAAYIPGVPLFAGSIFHRSLAPALKMEPARLDMAIQTSGAGYFILTLILSIFLFARAYRNSPLPTIRRKLKVTLGGTMLGLAPLFLVALLRMAVPNLQFPADRAATLMVFFLPASFGYAILRHGIFEIEFIVKRSLIYSGITASLILAYFLAYFVLRAVLHSVTGVSERIGSILAVLFVLLVMSPIRGRVQQRIDRWVYPDRYDSRRILREAADRLKEPAQREQVERSLLQIIRANLGVQRLAFFRPDPDAETFTASALEWPAEEEAPDEGPAGGREPPPDLRVGRHLVEPLFRMGAPIPREDLEAELPYGFLPRRDLDALQALQARVLMPLGSSEHRLGLVILGPRNFGEIYTRPDLDLLEGLQNQALSALQHLRYQEQSQDRQDLQREMEVARAIQQQLLPRELPRHPALDVAAVNVPSREVGGDYYDWLQCNSQSLTFAIGDVSGKGVPAALLMSNVQATFRAEAAAGGKPHEVLERMNRRLCGIDRPDRFVSFFCGRFDPSTGSLAYSNAGHLLPMLFTAEGRVRRLECGGLLLGVHENVPYEGEDLTLLPGETLLLFTDGVVERGAPDLLFSEEDLMAFALRHRHLSAQDLVGRILDELERRSGSFAEDDTTILVLRAL